MEAKWVHIFPKCIRPKVNAMLSRLAVQHVIFCATEIPLFQSWKRLLVQSETVKDEYIFKIF